MTEGSSNAKEISLGDDFGDVVVKANGAQVTIGADGSIHGLPAPANDITKAKTAPEVGDEMDDGTILAGYYEGKPLYATPRDAPWTYTSDEAAEYAQHLNAHGHRDFHTPSKGELNVLYENRNKGKLAGTFNETGSGPAGRYWSSSPLGYNNGAWTQRFSDGTRTTVSRDSVSSLRCVR